MSNKAFATYVRNCGIHCSDRVKILRKPAPRELGWELGTNSSMDASVGQIGSVIDIDSEKGFKVTTPSAPSGWWYPPQVLERVGKVGAPTDEMTKCYVELQELAGLKEGDSVKVLRKARDEEAGWYCYWCEPMDRLVGKVGIINDIDDERGVTIDFGDCSGTFSFPFFVLEKICSKPKPKRIRPITTKVQLENDKHDGTATSFRFKGDEGGVLESHEYLVRFSPNELDLVTAAWTKHKAKLAVKKVD